MTRINTPLEPYTIERTISSRNQLAYEEIIGQIRDLPTLPEVVLRVTEMVNNPRISAKDMGEVIAHDQVLTARLLKLVNSSYYGFPSEITKITTAIVILGFNSIKQLLLSTAVFDLFGKDQIEGFDRVDLLRHTIATAIASRMIGRVIGYSDLEELFVAGLLHDIGKVVMDRYFHDEYREILRRTLNEDITFYTAEQDVFDCDHTVLGQLLARHWKLPEKLISIIANHHHPASAGQYGRETAIVHFADILAKAKRIGSGGDRVMPELDPWSWELLALNPKTLESILAQLEDEFPQVMSLFELEG